MTTPPAGPPPSPPPIEGLEDIVLPQPVPYRPNTVGWYVLFALLLALVVHLYARHRRSRAANLYRRQALHELDAIVLTLQAKGGRHGVAAQLPELLKRVALHVRPREEVASLTGAEWLAELDRMYGGTGFTKGPGRLLPRLAYGAPAFVSGVPRAELDALVRLSREWIEKHHSVARPATGQGGSPPAEDRVPRATAA